MKIRFNGNVENVEARTLADLVAIKKIDCARVVTEHNLNIIEKNKLADIVLKENDVIEVLSFIGGG